MDENLAVRGVRAITPEGIGVGHWSAISQDQKLIAAVDSSQRVRLIDMVSGTQRAADGIETGDLPVTWTADGRYLYLFARTQGQINRWEMQTGRRQLFREMSPPDRTGLVSSVSARITPDGKSYAYSLFTTTSELYLVDGLN